MLTRTCLAIVAVTTAILFVPAVGSAATLSVTCGPGASLQNKIDSAPSGSTILVSGKCIGNFQITGKSLTLRGNPAATLDGNYGGTTLTVEAAGKSVRLERLTVTHGKAVSGGGITKTAGNLILNRVKVTTNEATPRPPSRWPRAAVSGPFPATSA
jgi:nitrous oxidase accessory protein NosD